MANAESTAAIAEQSGDPSANNEIKPRAEENKNHSPIAIQISTESSMPAIGAQGRSR